MPDPLAELHATLGGRLRNRTELYADDLEDLIAAEADAAIADDERLDDRRAAIREVRAAMHARGRYLLGVNHGRRLRGTFTDRYRVRRLIREGRLPSARDGGRLLVRLSDVDRYLAGTTGQPEEHTR